MLFYHLEEFDLFGYLNWKLKSPKTLGNDIFILERYLITNFYYGADILFARLLGQKLKGAMAKSWIRYFRSKELIVNSQGQPTNTLSQKLLGDVLVWQSIAVWQRRTEFQFFRTVWLSRTHFSPKIIAGCLSVGQLLKPEKTCLYSVLRPHGSSHKAKTLFFGF